MKQDVYEKITAKIVADLEQGVRPWMKPWNAEHAAGRITRPLRANGIPYCGINIVMLWMEALERGYCAPIWMTLKQALVRSIDLTQSVQVTPPMRFYRIGHGRSKPARPRGPMGPLRAYKSA